MECKSKDKSFVCKSKDQKVLDASEVTYEQGTKYIVVKFSKKHDKHREADKILNEVKIPEENELNLHLRIK